MDKIKRVINCVIPITACNFKCHYCYLAQENAFSSNIPQLEYDMDTIQRALTVERLGGICLINICAVGETLLAPYLVDLVKRMMANGHYVAIVTNGSLGNKIEPFLLFNDDEKKKLFFKFSYQYLQLKKLGLVDKFFDNVKMVRDAKISYTVEITANDETIPFIDELNEKCIEAIGASPHVIESRDNNDSYKKLTKLDNKEHMKSWSKFKSPAIKFQDTVWGKRRCEFCYAGDWEANLYLQNGNLTPCFAGGPVIQNIFEDVNEPIHFLAIGNKCPWAHCFASHVLLTYGIIPELDSPPYDKIRNRTTCDGKEWLQPDVKHFYHHKLKENNYEYSDSKKQIINWYRSIIFNEPIEYDSMISTAITDILLSNGIKKLALINNEKYINDLTDLLNHSEVNVKCFIDPDYSLYNNKIKSIVIHRIKYIYKKIKFKSTPVLKYYDHIPKVDAVLIANLEDYLKVKKVLSDLTNIPIILLADLEIKR